MDFSWMYVAAGFGVGTLVGLTGVGGGALMTPIMVLLFGVAPSVAVGTDLWFAALTKIVGGWIHGKKGTVDWQVLRRMFYGSLPAALLTLLWLHLSGGGKLQSELMLRMLGLVLIATSLAAVLRNNVHVMGRHLRLSTPGAFKHAQPALTVIAGAILGFLVTFTSIGAGALGAVMLLYIYPLRMKPGVLVGTDIVHAIPLTLVAGTGHMLMGNVNWSLLGILLLGSIPGIILGSMVGVRAPDKFVRGAIALVLAAVGVKMLLG